MTQDQKELQDTDTTHSEAVTPEGLDETVPHAPASDTKLTRDDKIKFALFIGVIVAMAILAIVLIPIFNNLNGESLESLVESVQEMGAWGFFAILALQLIQIIIAFIPGEFVQVAAGLLYGPIWGSLIILLGCLISTVAVFYLVQFLGAPFVHKVVNKKQLDKFDFLHESTKLDLITFILFLIPGMPKDVLTYIVALTDVKPSHFFTITTVARIPGVVISTWAGESILRGNWILIAVIVVIVLVLCGLVWFFRDRIIDQIGKRSK
jgi:uncharacterized membrane protein YdjX (TVP38/TMEM64 family)